MNRKNVLLTSFVAAVLLVGAKVATVNAEEKPVQHLTVADLTSEEGAIRVFAKTTAQLRQKTKLDSNAMNEIHIITYSLEKAVAYFSENMSSSQQLRAQKMVEVVEMIHLGSENNRVEETSQSLDRYFRLADSFAAEL